MIDTYDNNIQLIHSLFNKKFDEYYKLSNPRRRARLLPFIPTVYRRWLYSSMIEDTFFSPANIIETANRLFSMPIENSPVIKLKSENKYTGTYVETREYDLSCHPVVNDIKTAVNYCSPSIELNEEDSLTAAQSIELAKNLSLSDPNYASYLINIAFYMGLVSKIPSMYSNRAQVSRDCKKKLSLNDADLFNEIVEASIRSAAYHLNEIIPLPETVFCESFIRSILKKPIITDSIFERIYDLLGITLEDMAEMEFNDDFDVMDAALLSGMFMIGVAIDKFFFSPFGYYLKLIRPLYTLPFDFESEIQFLIEAGFDDDELSAAFFSPCSSYTLTELGLKHFNVAPAASNFVDVKKQLPFDAFSQDFGIVVTALSSFPQFEENDPVISGEFIGSVLSFKAKIVQDPMFWITFDISSESTLFRLFLDITAFFGIDQNADFSFFHDTAENPFAEYAPVKKTKSRSRKNTGKTTETTLGSLDFEHKPTLLLVLYDGKSIISVPSNKTAARKQTSLTVVIENTGRKQREPGRSYPVLTKISKRVKEMREDFCFY